MSEQFTELVSAFTKIATCFLPKFGAKASSADFGYPRIATSVICCLFRYDSLGATFPAAPLADYLFALCLLART